MNAPLRQLLAACLCAAVLAACAPVMVGGAAGGAAAANDPRSTAALAQDKLIKTRATDALYGDAELDRRLHINITVFNGMVLMTGEVLSRELQQRAVDIVRNLSGVKQVYNEVVVADLTTFRARSNDTWISAKVRTQLVRADGVDASAITVTTERSVAYLMGFVTQAQGARAAEVTSQIEGISKVVKLFEYSD